MDVRPFAATLHGGGRGRPRTARPRGGRVIDRWRAEVERGTWSMVRQPVSQRLFTTPHLAPPASMPVPRTPRASWRRAPVNDAPWRHSSPRREPPALPASARQFWQGLQPVPTHRPPPSALSPRAAAAAAAAAAAVASPQLARDPWEVAMFRVLRKATASQLEEIRKKYDNDRSGHLDLFELKATLCDLGLRAFQWRSAAASSRSTTSAAWARSAWQR